MELRDKLTQTQTNNFQKKDEKHAMKKGQSLQQMELGKLNSHMQENHTRPLSHTIHKYLLKWIKDLIIRPENIQFLEENTDSKLCHRS